MQEPFFSKSDFYINAEVFHPITLKLKCYLLSLGQALGQDMSELDSIC